MPLRLAKFILGARAFPIRPEGKMTVNKKRPLVPAKNLIKEKFLPTL
jgi:hypothetical protein